MNRSFIRPAALAFAVASLAIGVFFSSGAFAQSITLNDPFCLSFTLSGSPPNQTLSCVPSTTPLCTITGPAAGVINTGITLQATCAPAATSYTWTGGACATNTSKSCTDSGSTYTNNTVVNYTVTGTNAAGAGPASAAFPVTWTTTPPAAPTGCTLTLATVPTTLTTAAFTATPAVAGCSPSTGLTYTWTKNGTPWAGATTSNPTDSEAANTGTGALNYTYVPTICTSPTTCATLTGVTATQPGTGGGGGGINCTGYANTHVAALNWSTGGPGGFITIHSADFGGFGKSDAFIVQFTTPSGTSNGNMGNFLFAEYGGPPANRYYKVSTQSCDFAGAQNGGTSVNWWYTVGANTFGAPVLQPNTTYYVNMHNDGSCSGTCNIIFTLNKPPGL